MAVYLLLTLLDFKIVKFKVMLKLDTYHRDQGSFQFHRVIYSNLNLTFMVGTNLYQVKSFPSEIKAE